MSDTPETDGEWNRLACLDHPEFEARLADFARKLEIDRDEQKRLVDKLKVQLTKALEAVASRTS